MTIRPYQAKDKERLQLICRETAHESYQKSDATYAAVTILYNDYYTEQEPEHIFVATDENDLAIGYILCSVDDKKFRKEMKTTYKKRLQKVCPSKVAEALLACLLSSVLPKKYRPHLHIDILPQYQKKGIGKNLMNALRSHLYSLGVLYLSILSLSTKATGYPFYKKYGFGILRRYLPTIVALTIPTK